MTRAFRQLVTPLALLLVLLGAAVPATAQSGDDLFIKAFTCETDPGGIGMGPVPADCATATGIAFAVATEDGAEVGSCVTADFGGCVVKVPLDTMIVVTEDVTTVPAGFAPKEHQQLRQTPPPPGAAGEFIAEFVNVATDATESATDDDAPIASGGIGLPRAVWEAEHGPGAPCCMTGTGEGGRTYQVLSYEDSEYYVGLSSDDNFQNEVVTFVEWSWGVGETAMFDEFSALLPADAVLIETFGLPSTPDGPIAITVYRFESRTLAATMVGGGETGSIAVLYQEEPKASRGRVSITVGTPA